MAVNPPRTRASTRATWSRCFALASTSSKPTPLQPASRPDLTDGYHADSKQNQQAGAYAQLGAAHLAAPPGSSYHQFGRSPLTWRGGQPAQQQRGLIATLLLTTNRGRGITAGAHCSSPCPDRVHFQAAEGKEARRSSRPGETPSRVGTDANAPLGTAAGAPVAVSDDRAQPRRTLPSRDAQTVAANSPPGGAGFVGRTVATNTSVIVQGMTTGTSHNPQLISGQADWGHLGGAAPPVTAPGDAGWRLPVVTPPNCEA